MAKIYDMGTEKLFLVTDDTGKKEKSDANNLFGDDSFLIRALRKNAASEKRYTANKLLREQVQEMKSPVQFPMGESWLLTG